MFFNTVFVNLYDLWHTTVSPGSAATSLSYGWICNVHFVKKFPECSSEKNFEKRSIFREVIDMCRGLVSCFLTHRVFRMTELSAAININGSWTRTLITTHFGKFWFWQANNSAKKMLRLKLFEDFGRWNSEFRW